MNFNDLQPLRPAARQDGSVSLRSKSSDKYLAAEHPSWGVATADREEIDDWEKFNVTTVHGWDTVTWRCRMMSGWNKAQDPGLPAA